MKNIFYKFVPSIPRGRYARGVMVLGGGAAVGQVINLLISPILTRMYSPEEFGILAAYASILSTLMVVASFRYEIAIPLVSNEQKAIRLLVLGVLIALLASVIITIFVVFGQNYLIVNENITVLKPYLWLIPVGLFIAVAYQFFNYFAVRDKQFTLIAKTRIGQSIGRATAQLSCGFFNVGPIGLLSGYIVGLGFGINGLVKYVWKKHRIDILNVNYNDLRAIAVEQKRFPVYAMPSGVLNVLGHQVTPLFLVMLFGPVTAGWYELSQRVMDAPLNFVGRSVSQVYLSECSSLKHKPNHLKKLFIQTSFKLLMLGLIPAILLLLFGPYLFFFVFGEGWSMSGYFAQVFSFVFLARFVVNPVSQTLIVLDKQNIQLILDFTRLTCVAVAFVIIKVFALEVSYSIIILSSVMTITYLIYFTCYWSVLFIEGRKVADGVSHEVDF